MTFFLVGAALCHAGPQHWGSGYPYLVTLEQTAKGRQLVAYEAPLRAKNATWMRRWVDTNPEFKKASGPLAVGDFWPTPIGREYVALLTQDNAIRFIEAPEVFGTVRWSWLGKAPLIGGVQQLVAGDVLAEKRDQLVALTATEVKIYSITGSAKEPVMSHKLSLKLPANLKVSSIACGDFWGDKQEELALISSDGLVRFEKIQDGQLVEISRTQIAKSGTLLGVDWVKDEFDSVSNFLSSGKVQVYAAPLKPGTKPNPGPNYTGKAMSRQWLPGTNPTKLTLNMTGTLETPGKTLGVAAGRIFGYVNEYTSTAVRKRNGIDDRPDAEIAFTARFPIHNLTEGAPHFGWPFKGEDYGYDIAIKNNGSKPIPAGSKLTVWLGVPQRNADVALATMSKPTFVFDIKQPIPPFNQLKPKYLMYRVEGKWPYDLIPCSPLATWKKANLDQVGERWLVCKLEAPGDRTLRNNRYEAALHSHTFHPIHREGNLADRKPTVAGDPCSFEYLHRKLADAITCVWERSGTTDNSDVLQRAYLDGYEFGYPSEVKPREAMLAAWKKIQDKWEGWRELDIWTGENQTWENYDWQYSPELHESCHLFHPLGDLYGNYVNPVWEKTITMADGSPVQMQTNLWGPDLFGSGHALIGPNACELMKKFIVGSRGAGMDPWWTVAPKQVKVKIVDRNGKPVPNAEVTWWSDSKKGPVSKGTTDAQGCWEVSSMFGKPSEPDKLGITHYYGDGNGNVMDYNAMIFTVKIGDYVDEAICDSTDVNSHSRLTLFYQAMLDPNTWTWEFKTNYDAKAANPDFNVVGAVKGTQVSIGIEGDKGKFALYRRWEPAYVRERIIEFEGGKDVTPIVQDMAEADAHGKGRFRAIYEVTRITPSGESLPKRISVCGLKNAYGVTALKNGQLMVATNAGIANPFAVLFNGNTPAQEIFYHYRFGHTASKIVQSLLNPEKFYITLVSSDTKGQDYRFDIADPVFDRGGYDVRNDIRGIECVSYSGTKPQTIIIKDPAKAAMLNPGDVVTTSEETWVNITSVKGTTIVTDGPVFKPTTEGMSIDVVRLAGAPGDRLEFRELNKARSLACMLVGGKEFIAITDTGNNRVVVWNDKTTYLCHYADAGFTPISIATDPRNANVVWCVGSKGTTTELRKLSFDGAQLKLSATYPVVDGAANLAVIAKPGSSDLIVGLVDTKNARIVEFEISPDSCKQVATYNQAIGVYSGDKTLTQPIDLAYVVNGAAIRLYVIDGTDRMLRLK